MRVLFLFMALFVISSLYADSGTAIFSQAYSFDKLTSCVQSASLADDFVPYFTGDCSTVSLWMVFSGAPPATELYIKIARNSSALNPNSSITIFAGELSVTTLIAVGDSIYEEPIYQLTFDLPNPIQLVDGGLYWFEVGTEPGSYWTFTEPSPFGSGMWNYLAGHYVPYGDCGGFFELLTPVALERNSWAAIKSCY